MNALHTPVLVEQVVRWLRIRPEGMYADATVGTGGHALEIARHLTTGRLLGIDRDPRALDPEVIARFFRDMGIETYWEATVAAAVDFALRVSTPSDAIVILGSVALAGEARAHILGLERDPALAG